MANMHSLPSDLIADLHRQIAYDVELEVESCSLVQADGEGFSPRPGTLDEDVREHVDDLLAMLRRIEEVTGPLSISAAPWVRELVDGRREL